MVTVSVIVPVYNAEKYLKQTLLSIQNQTFKDFEAILIDDGSSDQSGEICDGQAMTDSRFKVIHQKNSGVAAARNAGIEQAEGEFIAFLDADDCWLPEKLEKQVAFMKEKNCFLSYTAYRFIDENGKVLKNYSPHRLSVTYAQLLKSNCMGCLTTMYQSKEIGKQFVPLIEKGPEDFAMLLSILRKTKAKEALCLNEILAEAALGHWYVLRKAEKIRFFKAIILFFEYAYRAVKKNKEV